MINSPSIGAERLSKMLRQPYDLYKGGYCDQYISGLMNQVSQAMDPSMSQEVLVSGIYCYLIEGK